MASNLEDKMKNCSVSAESSIENKEASCDIFTSEKFGCDESGNGSEQKPYKTAFQAMRKYGKEPFPNIFVDAKTSEKTVEIDKALLERLNVHFSNFSYINGHLPSECDLIALEAMSLLEHSFPYINRWKNHISYLKNYCSNVNFSFEQLHHQSFGFETKKSDLIAKSQLKKLTKMWKEECRKLDARLVKEKKDAEMRAKALEEAKKVVITEDQSLQAAKKIKIYQVSEHEGQRVKISGWVHKIRRGKCIIFVEIRDGCADIVQCVMENKLCQTYEALILNPESTVTMYGTLKKAVQGNEAPGQHGLEMGVDYWVLIGESPAGGIAAEINRESHPDIQLNKRHLLLREEEATKVFSLLSILRKSFVDHYTSRNYKWVSLPTLVQTQCEGGSTLFDLKFFGEKAYLTQSSQLYLETCLASFGDVFCIEQSYRAEQSRTRRHLAAYTHIEAECPFITFDELLERIEDLICDVVDRVMKDPVGSRLVKDLNPEFEPPQKNFLRMTYEEAIVYLKENNITKDDGTYYEFGEDIPEAPERKMTDKINRPILLNRFPASVKAFYMQKCEDDRRLTESVDVLMPGVGEIVGGSMRMHNLDELLEAYEKEGLDPKPYYWYTDQRRYGTCPHGGYGLGLERFLCWLANRYHIRDAVLYPRFVGRCTP